MKKFILPLALVAFSLAACGDDEEPTNVPDATLDVGISDTGDSDADDDTTVCEPVCDGRECGADGCGGTCGTCADGSSCSAGVCEEDVALNCIGIIQCVNGCTDATCAQGCIGQGTPEAQGQINAVLGCIQTNCSSAPESELAACQQEFCSDELNACNGIPPATGDATCGEIADCVFACTSEACVTECMGEASPEGRAGFSAVITCADANDCLDVATNDQLIECLETNCGTQYAECYDTATGECGDGNVDEGEECDDGNTEDGDGCSSECIIEVAGECGDGNVDEGEECDDGNTEDGDGCAADCTIEVAGECGDGNVDEGEECDDGNTEDGDGCAADCTIEPFCGDGNIDEGEECDDGNDIDDDECANDCTIPLPPVPNCEDYCAVVEANCSGDNIQYDDNAACMTACAEFEAGVTGDTVGDSIGCRTYHAETAGTDLDNASMHCADAGPSGGESCIVQD